MMSNNKWCGSTKSVDSRKVMCNRTWHFSFGGKACSTMPNGGRETVKRTLFQLEVDICIQMRASPLSDRHQGDHRQINTHQNPLPAAADSSLGYLQDIFTVASPRIVHVMPPTRQCDSTGQLPGPLHA